MATSKTSKGLPTVEAKPAAYNAAVRQGRAAIASQNKINWTLGDLALKVATVYGGKTIERFANDLDVEPKNVYDWRKVSEQYPADQRGVASWTVHQILGRLDDRFGLVQTEMTTAAARAIIASRKDGAGNGDGEGSGDESGNGDETPDDLPTQLTKAKADVERIRGELLKAEAKVTKITAEMDQAIATAKDARKPRAPRGARKLAAVA